MHKYLLLLALAAVTFGCGSSSDAPKTDASASAKSDAPAKAADEPADKSAQGKTIVGNWHYDDPKPDGANLDLKLNADKTMQWSSTQKFTDQGKTVNLETVMNGTYESTDKDLTVTFKDVKINGVPPEVAKPTEEKLKDGLNKPTTGAYSWKGDKEAEFTIGGQTFTYKLVEAK